MPTRESAPVGAPCWVDLASTDVDRSRAFYTELFGWEAEEPNPEFAGYFNYTKDGARIAGGNAQQEGSPSVWTVYLAVEDAEATAAAVTKHGGNVIAPPMAVADLGSMAFLTDPGGAFVGIWQPGTHKGFGILDEPDTPSWFELHTQAYGDSLEFYREVFGWDIHTAADEPQFRYSTLGEGDAGLAGVMDASVYLPEGAPSHWAVYFRAADVDATVAKAVELGATVTQPAEDTPYGRLAVLNDPTRAEFRLIGPNNAG
jgi:predicted enzyme related to lactoylglutathione lyase